MKLIPLLSTLLLLSFSTLPSTAQVKLTQEQTVIKVEIDGKPFTTYYFADGKGREYVRPFFYPVLAADGTEVTADQSTTGGDHPHHRSLWVSQGDVNGADHWAFTQKPSPKQRHLGFEKVEGDTIVQKLTWESKDYQPMLNETRTIKFLAYPDGARALDLTLQFTPVSSPVTFGDTKEAGLAAVRVVKSISSKPTLTNAEGAVGEKAVWGKKAVWCDLSGTINGKPYGVAILDHPSNPRHPTNWHAREYGLLAANCFGLHDFQKGLPKTAGNFTMQPGTTTTFRYRVIIHQGDAKAAKLDEKFKEYAAK